MYAYSKKLSDLIARKYRHLIQEQRCYDNVFRLLTEQIPELYPLSKISILFCYYEGADYRYYRHVFILHNNKIVEPLPYINMSDEKRNSLVPIKVIPSVEEYFRMVREEGKRSLLNTLYDDEIKAINQAEIWRKLWIRDLSNLYRDLE